VAPAASGPAMDGRPRSLSAPLPGAPDPASGRGSARNGIIVAFPILTLHFLTDGEHFDRAAGVRRPTIERSRAVLVRRWSRPASRPVPCEALGPAGLRSALRGFYRATSAGQDARLVARPEAWMLITPRRALSGSARFLTQRRAAGLPPRPHAPCCFTPCASDLEGSGLSAGRPAAWSTARSGGK